MCHRLLFSCVKKYRIPLLEMAGLAWWLVYCPNLSTFLTSMVIFNGFEHHYHYLQQWQKRLFLEVQTIGFKFEEI
jgi:hypothetical protein